MRRRELASHIKTLPQTHRLARRIIAPPAITSGC